MPLIRDIAGLEPTYEGLKLLSPPLLGDPLPEFGAYLRGIETRVSSVGYPSQHQSLEPTYEGLKHDQPHLVGRRCLFGAYLRGIET